MEQFARKSVKFEKDIKFLLTYINCFYNNSFKNMSLKKLRKIMYKYFLKKCQKDVDLEKNVWYIINTSQPNCVVCDDDL